jgi:hypothetical protein
MLTSQYSFKEYWWSGRYGMELGHCLYVLYFYDMVIPFMRLYLENSKHVSPWLLGSLWQVRRIVTITTGANDRNYPA